MVLFFLVFIFSMALSGFSAEASQNLDHSNSYQEAFVNNRLQINFSKLKKCSRPYEGLNREQINAIESFSFRHPHMLEWLNLSERQRKHTNGLAVHDQISRGALRHVREFIQTYDPQSCLPGNTQEKDDKHRELCLLAFNWRNLYREENKGFINTLTGNRLEQSKSRVVLKDPRDTRVQFSLYSTPQLSGISENNYVKKTWQIEKAGSSFNGHNLGFIQNCPDAQPACMTSISQWYQNQHTIDYYGRELTESTAAVRAHNFESGDLGIGNTESSCGGELQNPLRVYQAAISKIPNFELLDNHDAINQARRTGFRDGTVRGLSNVADAAQMIPDTAKGLWALSTNQDVPLCKNENNETIDPCPQSDGAYPCSNEADGAWCKGTFNLMVETLGSKTADLYEECALSICTSAVEHERMACKQQLAINPIHTHRMNFCFSAKIASAFGRAVGNKVMTCAQNPDEASRCFAQLAVVTGSTALTAGIGTAVHASSSVATGALLSLHKTGKISAHTLAVLQKSIHFGAKATNFSSEILINQLPGDANALRKMRLDLRHLRLEKTISQNASALADIKILDEAIHAKLLREAKQNLENSYQAFQKAKVERLNPQSIPQAQSRWAQAARTHKLLELEAANQQISRQLRELGPRGPPPWKLAPGTEYGARLSKDLEIKLMNNLGESKTIIVPAGSVVDKAENGLGLVYIHPDKKITRVMEPRMYTDLGPNSATIDYPSGYVRQANHQNTYLDINSSQLNTYTSNIPEISNNRSWTIRNDPVDHSIREALTHFHIVD